MNDQLRNYQQEVDNGEDNNSRQASVPQKKSDGSIKKTISSYFPATPIPLEPPTLDQDFDKLSILERTTESLKYNLLSLEFTVSPKGGLRQWIKINISLLLFFGIPILLFVPLATYFMGGFANITESLSNATQYLFTSALYVLKTIGVLIIITSILYLIFKFFALRYGKRGGESHDKGDYIDVTPVEESWQ